MCGPTAVATGPNSFKVYATRFLFESWNSHESVFGEGLFIFFVTCNRSFSFDMRTGIPFGWTHMFAPFKICKMRSRASFFTFQSLLFRERGGQD